MFSPGFHIQLFEYSLLTHTYGADLPDKFFKYTNEIEDAACGGKLSRTKQFNLKKSACFVPAWCKSCVNNNQQGLADEMHAPA